MKNLLRWAISNSPAMNILMLTVLGVGAFCAFNLRRETFPDFDLEFVMITVPFPGSTPEEAEEGICQKIEEAVRTIEGIKKITSTANEGSGNVLIELRGDVPDVDRTLNEIRSEVDRIPSFPELAEDPIVRRIAIQETIIYVGVSGPEVKSIDDELALRDVAERVRDNLSDLPAISQVSLVGSKAFQIDIEIPEETLRSHGLTLSKVAQIVRSENVKQPGGTIRARSQEVNVRTDNRRYYGHEIEKLPIVTEPDGSVLTLADLGYVRDEFVDAAAQTLIDRKPGIAISVMRNTNEDLFEMVDQVKEYVATAKLPHGYSLTTWGDRSVEIRSRLELLKQNGLQGLLIVFALLTLFLDIRLAFWVALGIPFSIFTTAACLQLTGNTLNMMSSFAIIMALGIVVDDAIVVGENIFSHRNFGKSFLRAAVDGTAEVLPSVIASVTTTIIAFLPLMFVAGMMGKFIFVLPVVIITMLAASLFECIFILPCHLAHHDSGLFQAMGIVFYVFSWVLRPIHWCNQAASKGMEKFISKIYGPTLQVALRWRIVFLAGIFSTLILALAAVRSGIVPYVFFPKIDSNTIDATVTFPNGTPEEVTDRWTKKIEDGFWTVAKQYEEKGTPVARRSFRLIGTKLSSRSRGLSSGLSGGNGHQGSVNVELIDGNDRAISSAEILRAWRKEVGPVPGAEELSFAVDQRGPGGKAIEFSLLAKKEDTANLQKAVERCKARLAEYPGLHDLSDSDTPGKWEFRLRIKEKAYSMGIKEMDLANTIRSTYFGSEVMRIQRGRHEVKIMVCYPRDYRRSLANFNEIRIQAPDGTQLPITELVDVKVVRGYTAINRRDQKRSITITADIAEKKANANQIINELKSDFLPELFAELPGVSVNWEGQEEHRAESFDSMRNGFLIALLAMFVLLSIEFRSYFQPFLILLIIPFGAVGAIAGHFLMGYPLCFFSAFGLVALSGIVVNDSIVLIDFINSLVRKGMDPKVAVIEAGKRRFRPVVLTSATTIGGLFPILIETSFQAQMLIPVAISIGFGVLFAMVLVLYLVPVSYSLLAQTLALFGIEMRSQLDDADWAPQPTTGQEPLSGDPHPAS